MYGRGRFGAPGGGYGGGGGGGRGKCLNKHLKIDHSMAFFRFLVRNLTCH